MGVSRFIWCIAIIGSCCLTVFGEEQPKETKRNVNYKETNLINNEVFIRKPNTNKTIAKVEAILAKNPSLPRLTRGEIIAILENITKTDEEKSKLLHMNITKENYSNNNVNKTKTREDKSLLVVLPYNPSNDSRGGLEVLYTKEPMTRLVLEATTPTTFSNHNYENATKSTETSTSTTSRPHKRRRKPMKPIVVMPQQEQRPVYVHNTKTTTTTQPPLESSSEDQWKPYTAYDSPFVVTQKPSTVDIPLPDNMKNTLNNMNLPKNHKPDGQVMYVTLPDSMRNDKYPSTTTTKRPRKKPTKPKPSTTTTPKSIKLRSTTPRPPSLPDIAAAAETLTPEMKEMLAQLGLVPGQPDGGMRTSTVSYKSTTIPSPINLKPINPTVDIGSYMSFKPLPVNNQNYNNNNNDNQNIMDNDMKKLLSNFGLISDYHNQNNYQPNFFRTQKSLDFDDTTNSTNITTVDDSTNSTNSNSTNSTNSNSTDEEQIVKPKGMTLTDINTDVLSDEMKDMLEDLGVIKESNSKSRRGKGHIFNPVTQSALLEQPDHAERISKVLDDIKKLSEDNATHALNPDEIKAHLENITSIVFHDEDNKNKETSGEEDLNFSQSENEADDDNDHSVVFGANGDFDGYEPDEEELIRIQNVHENSFINNVGNTNLFKWNSNQSNQNNNNDDDLSSKKLKEIISPPDPLSIEELHQMEEAENKNEVKRQQPESSSESSTNSASESETTPSGDSPASETTTAETTSTSTTTETPSSSEPPPNIRDLEDSFGGETPLVRPNGLYFLLDWNSFLRVGQDNRTVNLQFSPKVGDPRNFIPVNVP